MKTTKQSKKKRAKISNYRQLLDATYDWETFHDQEGLIVYCSPSCERITGHAASQFIKEPNLLIDIVHAEDRDLFVRHLHDSFTSKEPTNIDFRIIRPDGEVRYICQWCQAVHDSDGHFLGRRASNRDISDAATSQQKLRHSEARYRAICAAVTDYSYFVRIENGRITETIHKPTCLTLTGYSPEEFAANPYLWILMVVPSDRPAVEEQAQHALAGENVLPLEHRIIHKDGSERWLMNTILLQRDPQGQLIGYEGLVEDISAWKSRKMISPNTRPFWRIWLLNEPIHYRRRSTSG